MVKFRPQRGTLAEALNEEKTFLSLDEMYEYIILTYKGPNESALISKEDLHISEDLGKDFRTDWKESRYVYTNRLDKEMDKAPYCVGMCSVE